MQRGEVWRVVLPAVGQGREQSGERPVIVIQDGVYGAGSPLVLVVPLTSQLAALRFPATVEITPTVTNGLSLPSVAMVFQTRALDRTRFVTRRGQLDQEALAAVLNALESLVGRGELATTLEG
jgi:mRNA interferase MazF